MTFLGDVTSRGLDASRAHKRGHYSLADLFQQRAGTPTSQADAPSPASLRSSNASCIPLIATIYEDKPDIGQQLLGLLIIALDMPYSRGWDLALVYVEAVRDNFHSSRGGPKGRHCLAISSEYDMGKQDLDVLLYVALLMPDLGPIGNDTPH